MKVLFAVNNENISESIIKNYQQTYKEIISVKNVYYFNAIIKELQRDKSYDRIVISEDLEPFSNNNYEVIDKFIFEKMDSISDEATNQDGNDIPIILICSDRRAKSESLLVKLFGIGVYSALIGKDRSITNVCALLNKPRTKKEAKSYYHIDSDEVNYKVENEGDVSEVEIQNILTHYKKLGKNEEKYVESFDNIAAQYTDSQLKLIIKFLPLNVKAVLEANSTRYQQVMTFGAPTKQMEQKQNIKGIPNSNFQAVKQPKGKQTKEATNLEFIEKNLNQNKITEPVIIPSGINTAKVKKESEVKPIINKVEEPIVPVEQPIPTIETPVAEVNPIPETEQPLPNNDIDDFMDVSFEEEPKQEVIEEFKEEEQVSVVQPKRRGRPKKVLTPEEVAEKERLEAQPKRRGRPKKVQVQEIKNESELKQEENVGVAPVNLFELGDEEPVTPTQTYQNDMILPGLEEEDEPLLENTNILPGLEETDETVMPEPLQPPAQPNRQEEMPQQESPFGDEVPMFQEPTFDSPAFEQPAFTPPPVQPFENNTQNANTQSYEVENVQSNYNNGSLDGTLTKDKKIVAFVGTSKNGTSFLVNNLAQMLSQNGIKTAILDLTRNKNAYYIYTENEEEIRKKAYVAIENLRKGVPEGIQVSKNLTVYTTLPEEDEGIEDYTNILETLARNYSLVLLDCDFQTNYGYFKEAQEIYLVQSLDVLTIQPLTAFLRDLKAKNVLNPEKIRVVLNKMLRVRSVSEKTIIGGMAYYNDPAMSFMTELFNKDTVPYTTVPFEEQTYSKYLEGLINCKITLNGYSKNCLAALSKLGNMVYPLINNNGSSGKKKNAYSSYNPPAANNFSNNMNDTLNKMKNNY